MTRTADGTAEARRRAVADLRVREEVDVVDLVLEALADPDWRVRKEAVEVGESLAGRHPILPRVLSLVADTDDVALRNAAMELLGRAGERALPLVVEALAHVPARARKFVVGVLGEAGRPEDVSVLAHLLTDVDPNVAAAALEAVSRLGGPEAERILLAQLGSADPFGRVAALDGLDRMRSRVPFAALAPLVADPLTRKIALGLLGRTGDAAAVPVLAAALAEGGALASTAVRALAQLLDAGDAVRDAVVGAARTLPAEARRACIAQAGHGEPAARGAAVRILLVAEDREAIAPLLELAAHDGLGAKELGELRGWGRDVVRHLLDASAGVSGRARGAALELAGFVLTGVPSGDPATVALASALRAQLREELAGADVEARVGAARALLDWAEAVDAAPLTAAATAGPAELARAAAQALEALADRERAAVRQSLRPVALRGAAGAVLSSVVARLGDDDVVDRLRDALGAPDPATRRAAIEALAMVGGVDAADAIGVALTDEHPDVQATAARMLGTLRDASGGALGAERLRHALAATDVSVRAAAARALGALRDSAAFDGLARLTQDPELVVAIAALEALRAYRDPRALPVAVPFLAHENEELVKEALWVVAEVPGGAPLAHLLAALAHPAWDVRQLAAMLLGQTGEGAALGPLRARLKAEEYDLVRDALVAAIALLEKGR